MGVTAPNGYLMCDSTIYNANDYPELWKILPDNVKDTTNNTFVIDMCETVLVGAGTSGRPATELNAHDTYTLGEFKDDQMQQHRHELAVRTYKGGISHGYPYTGLGSSNTAMGDTSYSYDGTLGGVKSYMGNIDGRVGTTTHGKQIGVNYIIKY